ncbi:ribokinase [Cereibacter sphaeroides]|uniref:ribokinase n=1 Tax=Cereibacter sphaeroides TaxID=1063 RepID=UPI001F465CA9|nr:ribokinase [Cereibacter sphaeroides]MCE6961034.1 ribokinase [Cereibacter sphaeroides]MCE6969668.1 ribokinase [Cereibacter sphaeroides]MCE6975143.1 ribokinase [Cereibacter sphaeroides]
MLLNLGSINIDHVYRVPHLPAPGETLQATHHAMGLGGKGANQSVAAARAGARVLHVGGVGPEGIWARDALAAEGIDVGHVRVGAEPTGHAIIAVDPEGENAIIIHPGANRRLDAAQVEAALACAGPGDTLLLQNETSAQVEAAHRASSLGLRVIYSAAPFDVEAVQAVLPVVTLLVMNEGEAAALKAALGALPEVDMIVTRGAKGAEWHSARAQPLFVPAVQVVPVDTVGAGDCFTGNLAAALDAGLPREAAMRRAAAAAAVQVTRQGAAAAMPTAAEVDALLR